MESLDRRNLCCLFLFGIVFNKVVKSVDGGLETVQKIFFGNQPIRVGFHFVEADFAFHGRVFQRQELTAAHLLP